MQILTFLADNSFRPNIKSEPLRKHGLHHRFNLSSQIKATLKNRVQNCNKNGGQRLIIILRLQNVRSRSQVGSLVGWMPRSTAFAGIIQWKNYSSELRARTSQKGQKWWLALGFIWLLPWAYSHHTGFEVTCTRTKISGFQCFTRYFTKNIENTHLTLFQTSQCSIFVLSDLVRFLIVFKRNGDIILPNIWNNYGYKNTQMDPADTTILPIQ